MQVALQTNSGANYFNVLPPGSDAAIAIGSSLGNKWSGNFPLMATTRFVSTLCAVLLGETKPQITPCRSALSAVRMPKWLKRLITRSAPSPARLAPIQKALRNVHFASSAVRPDKPMSTSHHPDMTFYAM